ncbi:hypothetical protein N7519_006752 [Penicillium mononematosum]|uniref:uncharacterized protein n=1 Tax=Penicillium mononematosum TaxID=268346 RepID=UPI0025486FFB|nr:uncharacterized protein N7519_006752 [Penicillium mononematosum]KAJ6185451.1 hypothetical protein N7519_006752 [Penicillium mononematosum]
MAWIRSSVEPYSFSVKQVIASGGSAFVGEVDESTVMKYPLAPGGDMSRLEIEKKLLEIVGPHERIIGLKSFSSDGLYYLERAQRISWCREAAEAVAWIHSRGVLHCDIQPTNLLLDDELHIKLSDFQISGWNNLFALGCTIYLIMMGHAVFPEIVDEEEGWYDKVREKFEKQQFPQDSHACSAITSKCWLKEYESAEELLRDIEVVEKGLRTGEATQLE